MKTEHKYAQVLRWIADGEDVQARLPGSENAAQFESLIGNFGQWNYSNYWKQCLLSGDFDGHDWEFRLKPRTITVNGRDVQAGETVAPAKHSDYWTITFDCETMVDEICWVGDRVDLLLLERGLVHITKEAAIAHAKAMLNID